ncbi:MAG: type II secretion system F family protein [Desulfovibrionaceae bacterium]
MTFSLIAVISAAAAVFLLVWSVSSLAEHLAGRRQRRAMTRLKSVLAQESPAMRRNLLKTGESGDRRKGAGDRLIASLAFGKKLERLVVHADAKGSAGRYLNLSIVLGALGLVFGLLLADSFLVAVIGGAGGACLPTLSLKRRKRKRLERFEQQLPDALDLVGRALTAGLTLQSGLRMVADEFSDPMATEFRRTLDEINFGVEVDRAFNNLVQRVDLTDLKFFVVSVNIQRETGGNLAEIVTSIAALIRERFKLHGKIKVLSGEVRMSATVLVILPFVTAALMLVINPDDMLRFWSHPIGRKVVWSALAWMGVGAYIMKRMIAIKV